MGDAGAANFGLEKAEITVDESVKGLVKVVSLLPEMPGEEDANCC